MGKILIIKGADFSNVSVGKVNQDTQTVQVTGTRNTDARIQVNAGDTINIKVSTNVHSTISDNRLTICTISSEIFKSNNDIVNNDFCREKKVADYEFNVTAVGTEKAVHIFNASSASEADITIYITVISHQ